MVDTPIKMLIEIDDLLATPGSWFYTPLTEMRCGKQADWGPIWDPKISYHGCSVNSAAAAIAEEEIAVGPNKTNDVEGIYNEGRHRVQNAFGYASHTVVHNTSGMLAACMMELCVDRANGVGRTVNKQWCNPPESVIITGVYTHVIHFSRVYEPGFLGWMRIHKSTWEHIAGENYENAAPDGHVLLDGPQTKLKRGGPAVPRRNREPSPVEISDSDMD